MSRSMKKMFGFVNVEGGAAYDVTTAVMGMECNVEVSVAAEAA